MKDETTNALVVAEREFRNNPTSASIREKYKALYVKYPNIAEELKLYDPNTPTAKAEKDKMTFAQLADEEKRIKDEDIARTVANRQPPTPKNSINYMLPDKTMVNSFDGGRTYLDKDGESKKMPFKRSQSTNSPYR